MGLTKARRPALLSGVGLLPFLVFMAVFQACESPGGDPDALSSEEAEAVGLPPGTRLHRVTLGGRGAEEHAVPTVVQASPGDAVEFRTVDHRVHTLEFLTDSLSVEAFDFLEASGQTASPPLVARGTRFIVSLQNAPVGRYPFMSMGHGGRAYGVLVVGPPPDSDSSRATPSRDDG